MVLRHVCRQGPIVGIDRANHTPALWGCRRPESGGKPAGSAGTSTRTDTAVVLRPPLPALVVRRVEQVGVAGRPCCSVKLIEHEPSGSTSYFAPGRIRYFG